MQVPFVSINSAASNLLLTLRRLGIERVRFRILGRGRALRHTALVTEPACDSAAWSVSVIELFWAYSITPRQGSYELTVGDGCLAYTPPTVAVMTQRSGYSVLKKRRRKLKARPGRPSPALAVAPNQFAL
jgi:hypothetical protein